MSEYLVRSISLASTEEQKKSELRAKDALLEKRKRTQNEK